MIRPISVDDLARLAENGLADPELPGGRVHIFDVRDGAAFRSGHIPGARQLPHESVARWAPQRASTLELVVLVDDDGAVDGPARLAAAELAHLWFTRLAFLAGGRRAWQSAGRPVETGGPVGVGAESSEGARPEREESGAVRWATTAVLPRVP
jgi:rhodanese-related sulfurtransferase